MASVGAENERTSELQPRASTDEDRTGPVFANGNGAGNGPTPNNYMPGKSMPDVPQQGRPTAGMQIFGIVSIYFLVNITCIYVIQ